METEFSGTESAGVTSTETFTPGPENTEPTSTPNTGGGNPAWAPIREALGPSFQLVENHLKEFDKQAQSKIEKLNAQLKEYTSFGDVKQLQAYQNLAQRLDSEPMAVYEKLGEWLRSQGLLKEAQQVEAMADQMDDQNEDIDPRLKELQQAQEEMRRFLEAQEQERIAREADMALEQEVGSLRQAHPELSDADIREVLQRAAFNAQQGRDDSLEAAYQDYVENVVNRIRNAPRAGDSAPRLLPTGGGVPANQQGQSLGSMNKSDVQSLVAGLLQQGKG